MDRASAEDAPRLILGTAGHIDHGKTALIRALTGVDTDRLPEEKARGITIELGFAPLDLPGGMRLGVVDVPGHEGLVRTMVAGATGIDLVLLVVAADEGVMPQTREHVAICELLGIDRGVVALTKLDVAGPEVAELAAEEVAELLAPTGLARAPIVPVSAWTGEGLDALRGALTQASEGAAPRTPRRGPPRLHVDRRFEMRGFGPVVTGTLVGGALSVGEAVEILPAGARARVRGIQVHGGSAQRAQPGARCALNLQGVALDALSRGMVASRPDALQPTRTLDGVLDWLAVAPAAEGPTAVSFLVGTSERRARVAPIGSDLLEPGARGFARIHIDGDPVVVLPGDHFVVRGFARNELGGATLGGGVVLDAAPPHRRRSDPGLLRDLEALAQGEPSAALRVRIARSGFAGIETQQLGRELGRTREETSADLASLCEAGEAAVSPGGRCFGNAPLAELERRLLEALDRYHEREPLRPAMPAGTLRGALPDNAPREAAELALARLADRDALRIEGDGVRRPDHRPKLSDADEAALDAIVATLRRAGLEAPSLRDLVAQLRIDEARLRDLLAHLERQSALVRAPGDLWFDRDAVESLRARVREHFRHHEELETPDYKTLIGTTRRTAVPLMELLDEERFTVRRGEVRRLLAREG